MTETQANEKGLYIEPYGGGFIIALEIGNSAKYYGKDLAERRQPVIPLNNLFETKEEALEACQKIPI